MGVVKALRIVLSALDFVEYAVNVSIMAIYPSEWRLIATGFPECLLRYRAIIGNSLRIFDDADTLESFRIKFRQDFRCRQYVREKVVEIASESRGVITSILKYRKNSGRIFGVPDTLENIVCGSPAKSVK